MFNFAPDQNQRSPIELIPPGTPLLCVVSVESIGISKSTGGRNAKICLTAIRGPYERRKIWSWISDPNDEKHSQEGRQMSLANMQHMLESCGIFDPSKPETYGRYASVAPDHVFQTIMRDLDGKHVAIKVKIEKGTDGYEDRNAVQAILSPNPNGRTAKAYDEVKAGADTKVQKPAAGGTSAFGQPAAQSSFGGFGQQQASAPAPATAQVASQPEHPQSAAPGWLSSNGG